MASEKNIEFLKKFLSDKPVVDFEGSKSFPDEEKIYTISGMKRFFRKNQLTNSELDDAFNKIQNDKSITLYSVKVFNHTYGESFPYFYLTPVDELESIVKKLEDRSLQLKIENTKNVIGDTKLKPKVARTSRKK